MNRVGTPQNEYKLTLRERETVILFNEADGTAAIETFNARILRQLRKVAGAEGVTVEEDGPGYGAYIIPKGMIRIQAPHPKREISDEERQRVATRLKGGRDKKRQNQI